MKLLPSSTTPWHVLRQRQGTAPPPFTAMSSQCSSQSCHCPLCRYLPSLLLNRSRKRSSTSMNARVTPMAQKPLCPARTPGTPGAEAPYALSAGPPAGPGTSLRCSSYQKFGTWRFRWVSFTRMGFPVVVLEPWTTHQLDPWPRGNALTARLRAPESFALRNAPSIDSLTTCGIPASASVVPVQAMARSAPKISISALRSSVCWKPKLIEKATTRTSTRKSTTSNGAMRRCPVIQNSSGIILKLFAAAQFTPSV
mmetsp:Transcript_94697/g.268079  ORF Transcript_94697/g.268079 Transcript_94697/m.268079 type:complete len:254 (-) Transcript_94697:475-1236(-)